jgi:hypothetical protein
MNIKEFLNLTYYISKPDQFLIDFDKTHPKLSASQLREKEKYERIGRLRDEPSAPSAKSTFWDKF